MDSEEESGEKNRDIWGSNPRAGDEEEKSSEERMDSVMEARREPGAEP